MGRARGHQGAVAAAPGRFEAVFGAHRGEAIPSLDTQTRMEPAERLALVRRELADGRTEAGLHWTADTMRRRNFNAMNEREAWEARQATVLHILDRHVETRADLANRVVSELVRVTGVEIAEVTGRSAFVGNKEHVGNLIGRQVAADPGAPLNEAVATDAIDKGVTSQVAAEAGRVIAGAGTSQVRRAVGQAFYRRLADELRDMPGAVFDSRKFAGLVKAHLPDAMKPVLAYAVAHPDAPVEKLRGELALSLRESVLDAHR